MHQPIIAFIGAGNMASSLIGGLAANHYPGTSMWATDLSIDKLNRLKSCFNLNISTNNLEAVAQADVIVLAVKPNTLPAVIKEMGELLAKRQPLIISIVTGIHAESIRKWANCQHLSIVRCMPNTPSLLRSGITGLFANFFVTEEQKAIAESILRSVGVTLWFDNEQDLNIVTAISGSGPAYFFLVMEAMIATAQEMGLTEEQAQLLTVNTALGAAKMALESGKGVAALRQQVTSPGGTTEQAIKVLEAGGIKSLFERALKAAKDKAIELSVLMD